MSTPVGSHCFGPVVPFGAPAAQRLERRGEDAILRCRVRSQRRAHVGQRLHRLVSACSATFPVRGVTTNHRNSTSPPVGRPAGSPSAAESWPASAWASFLSALRPAPAASGPRRSAVDLGSLVNFRFALVAGHHREFLPDRGRGRIRPNFSSRLGHTPQAFASLSKQGCCAKRRLYLHETIEDNSREFRSVRAGLREMWARFGVELRADGDARRRERMGRLGNSGLGMNTAEARGAFFVRGFSYWISN